MTLLEGEIALSSLHDVNNAYVYAVLVLDIILVEVPP